MTSPTKFGEIPNGYLPPLQNSTDSIAVDAQRIVQQSMEGTPQPLRERVEKQPTSVEALETANEPHIHRRICCCFFGCLLCGTLGAVLGQVFESALLGTTRTTEICADVGCALGGIFGGTTAPRLNWRQKALPTNPPLNKQD